jgi:hypothetical protein
MLAIHRHYSTTVLQDLNAQCELYSADTRDPNAPQVMLWSLVRWLEQV